MLLVVLCTPRLIKYHAQLLPLNMYLVLRKSIIGYKILIARAMGYKVVVKQLPGTGYPPQVIRDWGGEDEDQAWAHLDNPPAHE